MIVTFGEVLLRLAAPGAERLLQSPRLAACFGGAEANVASALARLGHDARLVSRLPDGPLGDAALRALRAAGVDVRGVARGNDDRMGLYFTEDGAGARPGTVRYDRAGSAFARLDPATIDWPAALDGARWLHLTGITPALGAGPRAAVAAALAAAAGAGVTASLDLNYRAALWSPEEARAALVPLLDDVDVLIAGAADLEHALGVALPPGGAHDLDVYRRVCCELAARHGLALVALTLRESVSASRNGWRGALYETATDTFIASPRRELELVDRIGGGDAFAAGLIHARLAGRSPVEVLDLALAAGTLQQTVPGDFAAFSRDEVERLAAGGDPRLRR